MTKVSDFLPPIDPACPDCSKPQFNYIREILDLCGQTCWDEIKRTSLIANSSTAPLYNLAKDGIPIITYKDFLLNKANDFMNDQSEDPDDPNVKKMIDGVKEALSPTSGSNNLYKLIVVWETAFFTSSTAMVALYNLSINAGTGFPNAPAIAPYPVPPASYSTPLNTAIGLPPNPIAGVAIETHIIASYVAYQ